MDPPDQDTWSGRVGGSQSLPKPRGGPLLAIVRPITASPVSASSNQTKPSRLVRRMSALGRSRLFRPGTGSAAAQCGDLTHHPESLLHRRPRGDHLEFFQPAWVSRQAGGQLASSRPLVPDRGKAPIKAPRRIGRCARRSGDAGDRQSDSMPLQHPAPRSGTYVT